MWGKDRETGQKFVSSANSQIHSYITYFIYPSTGINNSMADLNFGGCPTTTTTTTTTTITTTTTAGAFFGRRTILVLNCE